MRVKTQLILPEVTTGALRVAFATKDGKHINDHFGWACWFTLFDITKDKVFNAGHIHFESAIEQEACDPDKKNFAKINALDCCHIVYTQQIGGPAAARLTRKRIQPLVVKGSPTIESVLEELKKMLNNTVPPWLRKLTQTEDPDRFERFDDDEDEELSRDEG